jgi:hypothetical protein
VFLGVHACVCVCMSACVLVCMGVMLECTCKSALLREQTHNIVKRPVN